MHICFPLQVKPDRMTEHAERHRAVRPEMLRAIEASGRRNHSRFLRGDGLLIDCSETDGDAAPAKALTEDPDTAAREAEAAGFFEVLPGSRPDRGAPQLAEVFNLEDQLAALPRA